MAPSHAAEQTTFEGYPAVRLRGPELTAVFCPPVGMVGCSLEHGGAELLGQRGGLARYEARGSTMGIPLLHPWANRLSTLEFEVAGTEVRLDPESPRVRLDPHGLPIHGLLAASPYWRLDELHADDAHAALAAELDFGAHPELLECFPFPHVLRFTAIVVGSALTISTTLRPTGDAPVPVSFGYHPYLRLPGVPREQWEIALPPVRRMLLDDRMIPTGESEPAEIASGALGERTFDDALCELPDQPSFELSGGGLSVRLDFLAGYRYAQLYAPGDDEVICFEPMTAPTNALVAGGPELPIAAPGESYEASFRLAMSGGL